MNAFLAANMISQDRRNAILFDTTEMKQFMRTDDPEVTAVNGSLPIDVSGPMISVQAKWIRFLNSLTAKQLKSGVRSELSNGQMTTTDKTMQLKMEPTWTDGGNMFVQQTRAIDKGTNEEENKLEAAMKQLKLDRYTRQFEPSDLAIRKKLEKIDFLLNFNQEQQRSVRWDLENMQPLLDSKFIEALEKQRPKLVTECRKHITILVKANLKGMLNKVIVCKHQIRRLRRRTKRLYRERDYWTNISRVEETNMFVRSRKYPLFSEKIQQIAEDEQLHVRILSIYVLPLLHCVGLYSV
ncbi:hypothetical protein EG68_01794 [Paragonimus skrjabini miyazakii]|uniref:Uncharacterized protein n=1 Tax=Paragonimus skrjabini miyazakii TaxID=59628 RepID=A0A8S9Z0D2_9TREM|nr:hypothetical protein EG68_01794 [Paragonimus skrjabini miyazakii]